MSLLPPREQLVHMIKHAFSQKRPESELMDRFLKDAYIKNDYPIRNLGDFREMGKKVMVNRHDTIPPVDDKFAASTMFNVHETTKPINLNEPTDYPISETFTTATTTECSTSTRTLSCKGSEKEPSKRVLHENANQQNGFETPQEDGLLLTENGVAKSSSRTTSNISDTSNRQHPSWGWSANFYRGFSSFCSNDEHAIVVKIWASFAHDKKLAFDVRIRTGITVEQLIGCALYKYIELKRSPSPIRNIEMYSLRIVDEDYDGNVIIDEDFPAIERSVLVQRLNLREYALCEEHGARERDQTELAQKTLLTIHLGSSADSRQTTTVEVPLDWTFGETVKYFCEKKRLPHESYGVFLMDNVKTEIPLQKTLRQWTVQEIFIMFKRDRRDRNIFAYEKTPRSNTNKDSIETPSDVKRYRVFRKAKFFNGKVEQILSVSPSHVQLSLSANERKRVRAFSMENVMSCDRLSDDKKFSTGIPMRLVIFREATLKYYDFEVPDTIEAELIINHIRKLRSKIRH